MNANQAGVLLDQDWVELIYKAKELGLTIEEIRLFLQKQQVK